MTKAETIQFLNYLTETCKDGELGYRTAAEIVRNTELETVFNYYGKQRGQFARALQSEVERLGGICAQKGTLTAIAARGWMNLQFALSPGDGGSILAACALGEHVASDAFERVNESEINSQTKSLIEQQRLKVKEAHAHMIRLKAEMADTEFENTEEL